MLVVWLAIIFGSVLLFSPSNSSVVAALMLAALSVSVAIFLITPPTTPQRCDLAVLKAEPAALSPAQVLELLRRGNERFASGKREPRNLLHDHRPPPRAVPSVSRPLLHIGSSLEIRDSTPE